MPMHVALHIAMSKASLFLAATIATLVHCIIVVVLLQTILYVAGTPWIKSLASLATTSLNKKCNGKTITRG
jgi:hypothetical protein